jgi:CRISPR-associated endonuclease/helicase Cas3
MTEEQFRAAFVALTGNESGHFPWQWTLYRRFISGRQDNIPPSCNLPTGLGKTSVVAIWLIAMAAHPAHLPRRLAYIVNRRTVVDQATTIVERIRDRLQNPDHAGWNEHANTLRLLVEGLQRLTATEREPLAISTLRGELADNEKWKVDPARPAIIVGTIDMIGSKLLFSGYGDGAYHRTHHTGLIGQDTLIVHDEAHLTPAFSDLLRAVKTEQCGAHNLNSQCEPKRLRVLELSATTRGGDGDVLQLGPEDEEHPLVQQRLNAAKIVRLHEVTDVEGKDNEVDLAEARVNTADETARAKSKRIDPTQIIAQLATAYETTPSKVLIYVRSPEDAQKVADQLRERLGSATEDQVALLTGTIRGFERDELVRTNPVYRALLNHGSQFTRTVYLVSTSAGEVGIDLDADNMVSDLTTLDSLIQRLGRVNRRGGEGRRAHVDVVMPMGKSKPTDKISDLERAMRATQAILKGWAGRTGDFDASPRALRELLAGLTEEEKSNAFSPKPSVPPLTDILLDAWSLTSVTKSMPGRPEVAPYLHGLTNDPPETYVAWRKELALLARAEPQVDESTLGDWFSACRIEARERLHDRTDRVQKTLEALLKAHRKKTKERDFRVVVLNERGEAMWSYLSRIIANDFNLAYRTIVLPVEAGGLNAHGMLAPEVDRNVRDVAEEAREDRRERWLLTMDKEGEQHERLVTGAVTDLPPPGLRELERTTLKEPPDGEEGERESKYLRLMVSRERSALESPETAKFEQTLELHTQKIVKYMKRIVEALGLDQRIREALVLAAQWHDRGKDRRVWQRYACNADGTEPIAKSTRYLHGRALGGYRHEFGSLLEAQACNELHQHPERDLILHLIAAHHGHARPHFDPKAFDHERFSTQENEQATTQAIHRFGWLQHRFGRWGLAWMESLLRCADIAASRQSLELPNALQREEVYG